jgi:hypothetical protein
MPNPGDESLPALQEIQGEQPLNLATRIDRNGKTTYHVLTSDRRAGVFFERVYDQDHQLIRLQKRSPWSRSETHFHPQTGAVIRLFEASTLPDGNSMTKDIVYEGDASNEAVVVVSPHGELVRRVERHSCGIRTLFQGQTDYNAEGLPTNTVNHYMDPANGKLTKREQIRWSDGEHRSMTEFFFFDEEGNLFEYTKTLYHTNGGPFLEEKQTFNYDQSLAKREICSYNHRGLRTCVDVLTYREDGEICHRQSTFFDNEGNEIAARTAHA